MKKTMLLASAAIIGVSFLATPAKAQGVPQAVEITKVDVQKVAAGYRASKVIGSSVLNDANQTIGKIDDLLVTRDGKEPYAVLSVGGFELLHRGSLDNCHLCGRFIFLTIRPANSVAPGSTSPI